MNEQNNMGTIEMLLSKLAYSFIFIATIFVLVFGVVNFLSYKGMPEADVFLGYLHQDGFMTFPKNVQKAKSYFLRAAEKGNANGQCELGELYAKEKSYQDAAYWYFQSAVQGYQRCEINFRELSFPNEKNVLVLLKKYADKSNAFAEFALGSRYIEGIGVEKNIVQGIFYLKRSALRGNQGAKIYLAGLYLKGDIVKQDYDEADKWLKLIKK